ncbi:MAG: hypothetical protein ABJG68_09040 [Crocinitomicaceae bacterium]
MSLIVAILGINTYFSFSSYSQDSGTVKESSFYDKVLAKCSAVEDPEKQIGGFDPNSAPSLPIGLVQDVGESKMIICIDSAYFLPDGAYFSAYMAIDFPDGDKKIAFAAKNIKFNPEGVQGGEQAKLQLVSEHLINLGPNTQLFLPDDGSCYVNWGCNGFESVNLHGKFLLNGRILEPVEPIQNGNDSTVTAEFDVNVQDLHNMVAQVDFTPFTISGLKDFEFTVTQASVDMSDVENPAGVTLPAVYNSMYPGDIKLWKGFHIKYFEVKLPESMDAHDEPTELYAQDMFIDDAGVTGFVGANNVLNLGDGETDGKWGFSIDKLELGFTTNSLTTGKMDGEISVPVMDDNSLEYKACISKNPETNKPDYSFAVNTDKDMTASALNSTLKIDSTSVLSMTLQNNKFKPKLVLNGDWTLDKENAKFEGIKFQTVTINSQQPYVSNGSFGLISPLECTMGGFSVALNQLELGVYPDGLLGVKAGIGLNFSKDESSQTSSGGDTTTTNSLSVVGGFEVKAEFAHNTQGKPELEFESFNIHDIALNAQTNAFALTGVVKFKKDDPVWGNGFIGEASMELTSVLDDPISMYCAFGKVNSYRYWAVDVTAPMPGEGINLGNLRLTSLSGGLSWHMKDQRTVDDIMVAANTPDLSGNDGMSSSYVPDETIGLGFSAGVGYVYNSEKVLHGEVVFGVQFNANGGLSSILLAGDAYNMITKKQRKDAVNPNYIKGTVAIGYDNQEKIFDMQMAMNAQFQNAITADLWAQLYISEPLWFFHLGTPSNPCSVNFLNFATANAYFMFGQDLPPMPAPPPQVSSVLNGFNAGRDDVQIASGNGIGMGANLHVGLGGDPKNVFGNWYAYASGYLGAGFDMTLYKYAETSHCQGTTGPFGANYWYMNGQLYAYGGFSAGAMRIVNEEPKADFPIISASMAMLLQGKFPKPSYVYGGINLQANVMNIFDLNITMDFDAGTDCQIVN